MKSIIPKKKKRWHTKAKLVADGRMQDRRTIKDNYTPTVATETLFLMAAIFADENRHVAIEKAFLHGTMTNGVYMLIHGQCVDVLCHRYADLYDGCMNHWGVYRSFPYGTIEAVKVYFVS